MTTKDEPVDASVSKRYVWDTPTSRLERILEGSKKKKLIEPMDDPTPERPASDKPLPQSNVIHLLYWSRRELIEYASQPIDSLAGICAASEIREIMHEQRKRWLPKVLARIRKTR